MFQIAELAFLQHSIPVESVIPQGCHQERSGVIKDSLVLSCLICHHHNHITLFPLPLSSKGATISSLQIIKYRRYIPRVQLQSATSLTSSVHLQPTPLPKTKLRRRIFCSYFTVWLTRYISWRPSSIRLSLISPTSGSSPLVQIHSRTILLVNTRHSPFQPELLKGKALTISLWDHLAGIYQTSICETSVTVLPDYISCLVSDIGSSFQASHLI